MILKRIVLKERDRIEFTVSVFEEKKIETEGIWGIIKGIFKRKTEEEKEIDTYLISKKIAITLI